MSSCGPHISRVPDAYWAHNKHVLSSFTNGSSELLFFFFCLRNMKRGELTALRVRRPRSQRLGEITALPHPQNGGSTCLPALRRLWWEANETMPVKLFCKLKNSTQHLKTNTKELLLSVVTQLNFMESSISTWGCGWAYKEPQSNPR